MVGARTRKFIVRVPGGYDGKKAWPVVFAFHGAGSHMDAFDTRFGFRAEFGNKAVLMFGESLTNPMTGGTTWMVHTQDNLAFVDAMIEWLKTRVCIDSDRLFATGQSSGGYFSQTLGCQRGNELRAVAPSSGGWREFVNCVGNPAVWMSHGKGDTGTLADVAKAKQFWIERKMCNPDDPKPVAPSPCVSYGGCKDDVPFVFCEHAGGHPWPPYATKGVSDFFASF